MDAAESLYLKPIEMVEFTNQHTLYVEDSCCFFIMIL